MLLKEYKFSWVVDGDMNLSCNVVHTTLKVQAFSSWYFDRGCSRYMTRNKSFFTNLFLVNNGSITFRDGNKAMICEK